MLGFSPLSSSPLGSAGDAPTPVTLAPISGVQGNSQAGVLGFTTVQQPTQEITGVEATAEVTNQPIARQPASVSLTGFDLTAEDDIKPVTLIIGSYFSVYVLPEHTAELGTLPLTGLTRVIEVTSAGELTTEVSAVGVAKVAYVDGVEATSEVGSVVASVDMDKGITGFDLSTENGTLSIVVNTFVDISGVDATLEITRMPHVPVITEVTDSFERTLELEELDNDPVITIISTGFENTVETEDLGNTSVVQGIFGFGPSTFVGNLGNTPVSRTIVGVEATGETKSPINDPSVATTTGAEGTLESEGLANSTALRVVAGYEHTLELGELDNESVIQGISGSEATQELTNFQGMPIASDSVNHLVQVSGVEATGELAPVQTSRNPSALLYPWEMEAQLGNVVALSVADVEISGQELTTEVGAAPTVSLITTRVVPLTGFDLTNSLGNVSVDGIVVDFETLAQNFEIARNVIPEALASRKVFPIAGARKLAA
jgi:hypothetical protein